MAGNRASFAAASTLRAASSLTRRGAQQICRSFNRKASLAASRSRYGSTSSNAGVTVHAQASNPAVVGYPFHTLEILQTARGRGTPSRPRWLWPGGDPIPLQPSTG